MRLAWIVAFLLLAAPAGSAGLVQHLVVSVPVTAAAAPATLAAGATGTTSLGASATSATTARTGLPLVAEEVLRIQRGLQGWDVRIRLVSATGFGALDSATVALAGSTTQAQVVVSLGTVTQSSGAALPLLPAGVDLSVVVSGTKASAGTSVLALEVLLTPPGGAHPAIAYPYRLSVA